MSKELLALEQRAKQKVITDPLDVGRITEYIFEMPFSALRKDEVNYKRLRSKLSEGFHISCDNLDKLSLEDVLILIGYEPGNTYFDSPLINNRKFGKRFNVAGDVRFIAAILNNLSKCKVIRISEFTHLGLVPFVDYLYQFVDAAYGVEVVTEAYRSKMYKDLNRLCKDGCEYVRATDEKAPEYITVGDLIRCAIERSCDCWVSCSVPLDAYVSHITDSYNILIRFFMNGIRMSLNPLPGRDTLVDILNRYGDSPKDSFESIDFEKCYEPQK